ncbi:MAG TPA: tRNA (adenosine(37)-N6)-threonylcarbamoyltransferase complex ATPase subunit type 1 TsaE [Candidatus Paceibacterota bacterium]|nr:tRNA (adenosine(37)-N6)-threonylcarbamoyltransferase complex ATPase subunit type 1 TsaE [Candidatus Paceibacterota bacterium]
MEKVITTLAELEREAARFAETLAPSPRGATLVALSGELGAGKTAFTKAVAAALGVGETVTSPTFVLEKIYLLGGEALPFAKLVHIDAYRLESGEDLASLGFDELMRDRGNLVVLEWPEKVSDELPPPAVRISIVAQPDGSRTISYG